MKTILLFFTLMVAMPALYAQEKDPADVKLDTSEERDKKIDITIKVNGYTVRIYGNASVNPFTNHFTFDGHVTITGNGENSTWPVRYDGSLKRGPNNYKYSREVLPDDNLELVEWTLSRLYLQDPKKIWFDAQ